MKYLLSLVFGALVGISGTFLHNGYRPLGVIVSLVAVLMGTRLIRNMYLSKFQRTLWYWMDIYNCEGVVFGKRGRNPH